MKYTYDQLVNVLESYKRMIENDNGRYPLATVIDIYSSINAVLREVKKDENQN